METVLSEVTVEVVTVDMAVPAAVLAVLVVTADTVVQVVVLGAQVAAVTEAQAVVMVDMVVLPAAWAVIESFEIRRIKQ